MNHHVIVLNLPSSPGEELPEPGKPPVTIDGKGFDFVSSVSIGCDCEKLTEVQITFLASVQGQVRASQRVRKTVSFPDADKPEPKSEAPSSDSFTQSFDGRDWAKAFVNLVAVGQIHCDEGTMIAWFANALMRGYDEARSRAATGAFDEERGLVKMFGADALRDAAGYNPAEHPGHDSAKWPTETTPPGRGHRPPTEYRTVIAGIDTLLGDALVDNQENANAHRLEQLPAPCANVYPTRTTPPGRGHRPPTEYRTVLAGFSCIKGERLTAEGRGDGAIDSVNDPMAFVRTYGVMPPHLDRPDAELSEGGINQRDACAHEIELHRQRVTADIEDMTRGVEVSDMGVVRRQASERVAAAGIFPVSDNIPFAKDGPAIVYSRDAVVEARRKETLAATRARKPT